MAKLLALCFIMAASTAAHVGNFWFTFGIWPKSWWSMVIFAIISTIITSLLQSVLKEEE